MEDFDDYDDDYDDDDANCYDDGSPLPELNDDGEFEWDDGEEQGNEEAEWEAAGY